MIRRYVVSASGLRGPRWVVAMVSVQAGAVLVAWLAGCATYNAAASDVADAVEQWQRPQRAVRIVHATSRPVNAMPAPASAGADSTAVASNTPLQVYIAEALHRHPSVKAAVADAEAKLARIPQVTSLEDPMLRAVVRPEPIQTAVGDTVFTLGVNQKLPLPAKLDRAGRMAAAEVRMAIERLNRTRLQVIADVERAYFRLYVTDRSIELTQANRALLADLEQVVASKYRVGSAEQSDVLRVQTELSNLINEESRYRQSRYSAAAALNQLLDAPPATSRVVTEPIAPQAIGARADDLVAVAAEHNPELAALAHQAQRDRERVALADLGYWPDLNLGLEWNHLRGRDAWLPPVNPQTGMRPPINRMSEDGTDNWALMAQVNVPLWAPRIEAARREARQTLASTQHQQHAAANLVAFRIHDAWAQAQTHQDTIVLLTSTLIPQAQQTYEVSLTAYQAGRASFLTVIDNWRQLLAFELMRHREIAQLEIAFSELQREVGVQLIREGLGIGTDEAEPVSRDEVSR